MKRLGLIGGLGWESTAFYYAALNREVRRRMGGFHSARVLIESFDFHEFATARGALDYERMRGRLVESAKRLESAGAEAVMIACNTVHRFASSVQEELAVPFLHIADPVVSALLADGHRKAVLLGTRATMQGDFYTRVAQSAGIELLVPPLSARHELHALISGPLNASGDKSSCADALEQIFEDSKEQGATAAILGCTELRLAFPLDQGAILCRGLPAYDSALLHALAGVDLALA